MLSCNNRTPAHRSACKVLQTVLSAWETTEDQLEIQQATGETLKCLG